MEAAVGVGAARAGPVSAYADDARADAREILDGREFRDTDLPRPLEDPFERLGRLIQDAFNELVEVLPGGGVTAWALAAAVLLLAGAVLAARVTRRQVARDMVRARAALTQEEDPRALLRAAEDAERGADLELALRLRFRAGLLDLDRRGLLAVSPAMPTGAIRRELDSRTFDRLAASFEEVAYGGRAAEREDVDVARQEWPRVREEAGAR